MTLSPASVMQRLDEIERDLATRQNTYEHAAEQVHRSKRNAELSRAVAYQHTTGTVAEREAAVVLALAADPATIDYSTALGAYEGVKAVCRVLETRASIGMALLKSMGRS